MSALHNLSGAVAPAATIESTLYAVPSNATTAVVSSVVVCNRSASETRFRLSCSFNGTATQQKDFLYYDVPIPGNNTFVATVGLTPQPRDVFRVYSLNGSVSFSIWGSVII